MRRGWQHRGMDTLTPDQVRDAEGLERWEVVPASIRLTYDTGSLADGLAFANRIGEIADEANHHPDLEITYPSVTVTLTTHDAGGITELDVDLARRIDEIARELGIGSAS